MELTSLELVTAPAEILSTKAFALKQPDQATVGQMLRIMHDNNGAAIAAPQVGISDRYFVADEELTGLPTWVFDPMILLFSDELVELPESCLSISGLRLPVSRPDGIHVRYIGPDGVVNQDLSGWAARVFQHEFDHLEGVLFVDRFAEQFHYRRVLVRPNEHA